MGLWGEDDSDGDDDSEDSTDELTDDNEKPEKQLMRDTYGAVIE